MSASPMARFFSVSEVATQLGVSTKTVRRWIEREELHVHHLGRQLRVSDEDLSAFIRQCRR
jgi:excisionase family DNA binding protein